MFGGLNTNEWKEALFQLIWHGWWVTGVEVQKAGVDNWVDLWGTINMKLCANVTDLAVIKIKLVQHWFNQSFLNLCIGRPPTGVMIPDAV